MATTEAFLYSWFVTFINVFLWLVLFGFITFGIAIIVAKLITFIVCERKKYMPSPIWSILQNKTIMSIVMVGFEYLSAKIGISSSNMFASLLPAAGQPPREKPVVQPVTQPVTQPVVQPVVQPVAQPVTQQVANIQPISSLIQPDILLKVIDNSNLDKVLKQTITQHFPEIIITLNFVRNIWDMTEVQTVINQLYDKLYVTLLDEASKNPEINQWLEKHKSCLESTGCGYIYQSDDIPKDCLLIDTLLSFCWLRTLFTPVKDSENKGVVA